MDINQLYCILYLENQEINMLSQSFSQYGYQRRILNQICTIDKLPDINRLNDGEIECVDVIEINQQGIQCQEFIYLYVVDTGDNNLSQFQKICVKCQSGQSDCNCPDQQYYNYETIQCENCPSFCDKCAFDIFSDQQLNCYSCKITGAIPPDCQCQNGYFQIDTQNYCTNCKQMDGANYYYDFQMENPSCEKYVQHSITDTCYYLSNICKKCQENLNFYCEKCTDNLDAENPSICQECQGNNRNLPDCECKDNFIPEKNNEQNCVQCLINQYFDNDKFILKCSSITNIYNSECNSENVCTSCINYNKFCEQCDENQCLLCKENRVPPLCLCENQMVPDQVNTEICIQCNTDQYFSEQQYINNCYDGTNINYDCTQNDVCKSCEDVNTYCIECNQDYCFKCSGDLLPPNCQCPDKQEQTGNICTDCGIREFYDQNTNQCLKCKLQYNKYCLNCDENVCLTCKGDRQPPDCVCNKKFNQIPSNTDDTICTNCDQGTFYSQNLFDLNCSNGLDYDCNQSDVCQSCNFYSQFCLTCDENTCLTCEGDRKPPECMCPYKKLIDQSINNQCTICDNGYYLKQQKYDENCLDSLNYDINCNPANICFQCTDHNQFCKKCNEDQCIQCDGENRMAPDCICENNLVPSSINIKNCVTCPDGKYFSDIYYKNFCLNTDLTPNYSCTETDVCQSCTDFNKYCQKCNQYQCIECQGNRMAPNCICQDDQVPISSQLQNCQSCDDGFYFSDNDYISYCFDGTNVVNIDCDQTQVCLNCNTYNIFCTECNKNECTKCQGNRIPPLCICQEMQVPQQTNTQNCKFCNTNQFYNQALYEANCVSADLLTINYTCDESQVCQECASHWNKFCIECNKNECLKCSGDRIAPNCLCENNLVPDNLTCISCQTGYFYSSTLYQQNCENSGNINYDCEWNDICENCKNQHNKYCKECTENQCTQCEENRIPPLCLCPDKLVPNQSNLNQCVQCGSLEFYSQEQYNNNCYDGVNVIDYDCDQTQICVECTQKHNSYCLNCNEYTCQQCSGDRVIPDCLCGTGLVPDKNDYLNCSLQSGLTSGKTCNSNTFYSTTNFINSCYKQDGEIDYTCTELDICVKCKNEYNSYCKTCSETKCLTCLANRIPPNCLCPDFTITNVANPNGQCIQCPSGYYFSSQLYSDYDCGNPINYQNSNCYSDIICQPCTQYNIYCTECSQYECLLCSGNKRVLPYCNCQFSYVPDPIDPGNCKECDIYANYYFDKKKDGECTHEQKQNQDPGCAYGDICVYLGTILNNYCNFPFYNNSTMELLCYQCLGNRQPPYCQCPDKQMPDPLNDIYCKSCADDQYYDPDQDSCKNQSGITNIYDCQIEDACINCSVAHNKFCIRCTKDECITCQGNRIPPYCKCQDETVTKESDQLNCYQCSSDTYYNTNLDSCALNQNDGLYDCFFENVCTKCTVYNKFCIQCNSSECLECEGNRKNPNCKCPQNTVPETALTASNCQECFSGFYYYQQNDDCRFDVNDQIYDCYQDQICLECNEINYYCTTCNPVEGCLSCDQNRVLNFCKCPLNMVQSDLYQGLCVECAVGTYYDYNKDLCRYDLEDQMDYDSFIENLTCYEKDVCMSCGLINKFCTTCYKQQDRQQLLCTKCEGDLSIVEIGQKDLFGETLTITSCGCPQGYYSFSNDTKVCQECMQNAKCLGFDLIIVDPGYWRYSNQSSEIYECQNNPDVCLGGGDSFTCDQGHVGALCEACDIYGEVWGQTYGKSSQYECIICNKVMIYLKVILYTLCLSILASLMTFFGVKEVQTQIQEESIQKMFGSKFLLKLNTDQLTIYVKIFLSYFSSISILTQLDALDLGFLKNVSDIAGSPSKMIGFSADCFAADIGPSIPVQYIRICYLMAQFICYVLICAFFFLIFRKKLFKTRQVITFYTSSQDKDKYLDPIVYDPSPSINLIIIKIIIFIFVDIQPSFIQVLMDSLSCKNIGSQSFQISDTTLKCTSKKYISWSLYFSLPMIIFWGVMLPTFLVYLLRNYNQKSKFGKEIPKEENKKKQIMPIFQSQKNSKNHHKNKIYQFEQDHALTFLDSYMTKYKYGFLYLEVKNQSAQKQLFPLNFSLQQYSFTPSQIIKNQEKIQDALKNWNIIKLTIFKAFYLKNIKGVDIVKNQVVKQDYFLYSIRFKYPELDKEFKKYILNKKKKELVEFQQFIQTVREKFKKPNQGTFKYGKEFLSSANLLSQNNQDSFSGYQQETQNNYNKLETQRTVLSHINRQRKKQNIKCLDSIMELNQPVKEINFSNNSIVQNEQSIQENLFINDTYSQQSQKIFRQKKNFFQNNKQRGSDDISCTENSNMLASINLSPNNSINHINKIQQSPIKQNKFGNQNQQDAIFFELNSSKKAPNNSIILNNSVISYDIQSSKEIEQEIINQKGYDYVKNQEQKEILNEKNEQQISKIDRQKNQLSNKFLDFICDDTQLNDKKNQNLLNDVDLKNQQNNDIYLEPGFWRINAKSINIYECQNNPEACAGGEGDFICAEGYKGALCESCDFYGEFWEDQYGNTQDYQCGQCQPHSIKLNYPKIDQQLQKYLEEKEKQEKLQFKVFQNQVRSIFLKKQINNNNKYSKIDGKDLFDDQFIKEQKIFNTQNIRDEDDSEFKSFTKLVPSQKNKSIQMQTTKDIKSFDKSLNQRSIDYTINEYEIQKSFVINDSYKTYSESENDEEIKNQEFSYSYKQKNYEQEHIQNNLQKNINCIV
ncbi:hypothetical protein PPERSA_07580 [Pseudocohnilembus persalinus]|uniref:Insulin-like growth factor binding protein, N-terminal n=1 Tax=Pseudocohnilembus persalinus TaxID=266149 RepID=A0A0V0QZX0_PSEPJ|nr:hypothetical protein PPERSA_07580 [Pseudocohnilembus persalinus]|eukprot:KRX07830.1 hypothetical protein PPERSA_07580 [Pseudocohnilembus persalinus]